MKKNVLIYIMCLWAVAWLPACTNDDDPAWPEGGVPLELYATVEGHAGTRAGTRAIAENSWDGGEEILLRDMNPTNPLDYTYTVNKDGKITAKDGHTRWDWWNSFETKELAALCPVSFYDNSSVQQDQRTAEGYRKSDCICAKKTSCAFTSADKTLTFRHLTAKVVVHLKAGYGVTDNEIESATVTFENLGLKGGNINWEEGTLYQVDKDYGDFSKHIQPNEVDATDGYVRTVRALLVPQERSGKKFVKIATGGKTYYYTPGTDEANFHSGKLYEYYLTVTTSSSRSIASTRTEGGTWQLAD